MDDTNRESQDWFAENAPLPDNTGPMPGSGALAATQSDPDYDWFAANAPAASRGPAAVTSWQQDLEKDLWGSGGAEAGSQPPGQRNGAPGSSTRGGNAGSGMRPETARFLRDLAGIGTPAYLDMRSPQAPAFEDWRDRYFAPDGAGNYYMSQGGLPYTEDELEQMHGLLSRQAGNPLISGLFKGPKSTLADYMVWRNQNFAGNQGTWQDEDGTLYSGPALEELFAEKSQAQSGPAQASQGATGGGGSQQQTSASSGTRKSVESPKRLAMGTALPKELINQQQRQQLNKLMTGIQNPATRPLGVVQDGSLIVDVSPPQPTARPVSPPTVGPTAKQQRDQLNGLMSGIGSPGATPYGVAADGSIILDLGPQVRAPSTIPQQGPVAPQQLQEDPATERRTMSRLLRDLRQPSNTPMGETRDKAPMLDLTSQLEAPSRLPRQYDSDDYFSNVNIGLIKGNEGGTRRDAYVPPPDKKGRHNSGVTIAGGFDLGQHSVSDLQKLGLPQNLIDKFTPYLQLKGDQEALDGQPLSITDAEASAIDRAAFRSYPNDAGQAFNKARATLTANRNPDGVGLDPQGHPSEFAHLPWQAQTAIADLWYNLGDLSRPKGAPRFWKQVTTGDWEGAYQNLRNFSSGDSTLARRGPARCQAAEGCN